MKRFLPWLWTREPLAQRQAKERERGRQWAMDMLQNGRTPEEINAYIYGSTDQFDRGALDVLIETETANYPKTQLP